MSVYEDKTFENLMESTLERVNSDLDRREGSIIYNSTAPAIAELAQLYAALDFVMDATYIGTAPRDYLIERAKDHGIEPKAATGAVFRAELNKVVPVGSRFSCGDLNFAVTERMSIDNDTQTGLSHKVKCETAGAAANGCTGALVPIEYIDGLTHAAIASLLVPGEDEEETEAFRARLISSLKAQPFGGNQADYKKKALELSGVSAVKVYPVWNEDISPESLIPGDDVQSWYEGITSEMNAGTVKSWLTAAYTAAVAHKLNPGGTVKIVIMAADHAVPSAELVSSVQTAIDPAPGEGKGMAPIGHVVTVEAVGVTTVNIAFALTYTAGKTWSDAKNSIEGVIDDYFCELADGWESSERLVVRISQIESRILTQCSTFVTDITGTTLNGTVENITVATNNIPKRGTVAAQGGS